MLLALVAVVILFVLTGIWPATALALQLVGYSFISVIIYFLGLTGGVTYLIFGLQILSILFFTFQNKTWPFRFTKTELMTFGIVLLMFMSLLYTSTPLYGREKTLRFIGTCLILLVGARFFALNEVTLKKTLKVLAWCGISVMFLYIFFFVYMGDVFMAGGRFGGKEGSLIMGWSSAAAAVLMMYLILGRTWILTKAFASVMVLIAVALVASSGSRGPFVALIVGAILAFLSTRSMTPSLIAIFLVGVFAYVAISYMAPEPSRDRISHGIGKDALEESGRTRLFMLGLSQYSHNLVLGGGAGSFARTFGSGADERGYPHNIIIEVAAETGTIGLVLLGMIFWYCAKSILLLRFSLRSISIEGKIIQYLFWVGMANAMLSFDIPDQRILFCAIGFLAAIPNLHDQMKSEELLDEFSEQESTEVYEQ